MPETDPIEDEVGADESGAAGDEEGWGAHGFLTRLLGWLVKGNAECLEGRGMECFAVGRDGLGRVLAYKGRMRFTFYGHSCFLLETAGVRVLVDPFFSNNPAALAAGLTAEGVRADWILVSHGHFDHIADAVGIAVRTGARVAACYEVTEWMKARGVSAECLEPMNVGGAIRTPFGRVRYTVAEHSSTLPDGTSGGVAGGFLVENAEGTFFYSGDSALTREFRTLGELYRIDVAALCMGDRFTMGPSEAAVAARWLRCLRVIGVHYDTWAPIVLDREEAGRVFEEAGVELLLPAPGESVDLG